MGLWTVERRRRRRPSALLTRTRSTPHFDGHWSPDGKKIVFVFDILQGTDGKLQINTADADGTSNKTLIPNKAFEESPRWSPDGKRIAWVSTRDGNQEIYTADAEGKDIRSGSPTTWPSTTTPPGRPTASEIAFASNRARQLRDLHDERRRQRREAPHRQPRDGLLAGLVARRQADRLHVATATAITRSTS